MAGESDITHDPHNLNRFVQAQAADYERALAEIRSGNKRSHWMWYIFPPVRWPWMQLNVTAIFDQERAAEAQAYLQHRVLGRRLIECAEAALGVEGRSVFEIFGSPDDMKLRSCATLFASVSPAGSVFQRLLDKYFHGKRDEKTLSLLGILPDEE